MKRTLLFSLFFLIAANIFVVNVAQAFTWEETKNYVSEKFEKHKKAIVIGGSIIAIASITYVASCLIKHEPKRKAWGAEQMRCWDEQVEACNESTRQFYNEFSDRDDRDLNILFKAWDVSHENLRKCWKENPRPSIEWL